LIKKTADNIVLAKCGVKRELKNPAILAAAIFPFH